MMPVDYKRWVALQKELEAKKNKSGHWENKQKTEEEEALEDQLFEAVSKRAWTDVLLQLYKVYIMAVAVCTYMLNIILCMSQEVYIIFSPFLHFSFTFNFSNTIDHNLVNWLWHSLQKD